MRSKKSSTVEQVLFRWSKPGLIAGVDEALPLELATRRARHDWTADDPRDRPGSMLPLVDAVRTVEDALVEQLVDLDGLGTLVALLDGAGAGLEPLLPATREQRTGAQGDVSVGSFIPCSRWGRLVM